jgi:DNA polymerase-4
MAMPEPRDILHVDMDAFFAAIELLRHPELRGRPLVVGGSGDPMQRAVVSTASYEARRFGIHSGMALRTALHHCPQAVFLPVDYRHYARIAKRITAILRHFCTRMEAVGLDEAFLDVTDLAPEPLELARAIKAAIRDATGLSASVGIGPNKLLAKIASDLEKPDGLTRLGMADIPARVWPLPVRRIWGIGPKSAARLAEIGVATIGELAVLDRDTLVGLFGHAHGEYLYRAARGIDDSPVVAHRRRKSVGHETTFQQDVTERSVMVQALDELLDQSLARLRQGHHRARTVTVKLRYADFETHTRSLTLAEAGDSRQVMAAAVRECLGRFALRKAVRLVGVRLSHLEHR